MNPKPPRYSPGEKCGAYIVTAYVGFSPTNSKPQHMYAAKCCNCGMEHGAITQTRLWTSRRRRAFTCINCVSPENSKRMHEARKATPRNPSPDRIAAERKIRAIIRRVRACDYWRDDNGPLHVGPLKAEPC